MKLTQYEEWIKSVHQSDGITQELEDGIRRDVVTFMVVFGKNTDLRTSTIAKAIFIFHQYSKLRSFKRFDYLRYAVTCIFITSKFEDTPLKLEAIAQMYLTMNLIYQKKRAVFSIETKGLDAAELLVDGPKKDMKYDKTTMQFLKDKFISIESDILFEIGFDLDIDLPYSYFKRVRREKSEFDERFLDAARLIINRSWLTTFCLYFEPKLIVLGALNLAQSMKNSKRGKPWKDIFGEVSFEEVTEVTKYLKKLLEMKVS